MREDYDVIGDVRGKGLMIGAEIVKPDGRPDPELTGKVCWRAFELGLILPSYGMFGNVIRITPPPLVITEELAEKGLEIMERALKDALAGRVSQRVITCTEGRFFLAPPSFIRQPFKSSLEYKSGVHDA